MQRPLAAFRLATGIALALGLGVACKGGSLEPLREGGVRVLFVGNSLTYANDLPRTIADMAKAIDETPLVYRTVAKANYALEDHYHDGIERSIAGSEWRFVVMQQGPSTLPTSRTHLVSWTEAMDQLIVAAGARSALYSVWPGGTNAAAFDAVRGSYLAAAQAVDGMFIPAGEAWREAWLRDPAIQLYAGDDFHPSRTGTYLAALVHFEMLYGRPATDLPDIAYVAGGKLGLDAATVAMLQESAHAAVLAWGVH